MKRFLVFLVFLFFIPNAFAQWEWMNPKPQGNYLSDIYLFNSDTILAVGDAGTIIKSFDSGTTWFQQYYVENSDYFETVSFFNENVGYALRSVGILYKTIDGGLTWTYVRNFYQWMLRIEFVNENIIFICGHQHIYKTTDGGVTWISNFGITGYFFDMTFVNSAIGWVVGSSGQIYKTNDCGLNWVSQVSNSTRTLVSIDFLNEQIGVAVGRGGTIVKTLDGGNAWVLLNSNITSNLNSVICIDSSNYIAVGDSGVILKTSDAGNSWSISSNVTSHFLSRIRAHENHIWITGDYGLLLHSEDFGLTWAEKEYSITRETLNDMFLLNNNIFWMAGSNGKILHSSDGGTTWINQYGNDGYDLFSIDFVDSDNGWAAGYASLINTTNGGSTWLPQQMPVLAPLYSVDFFNENFGIVVGDYGAIFKTTNGGLTWLNRTTGSALFYDVFIYDLNLVWTVSWDGLNSKIYKSTSEGNSWTQVGMIPSKLLRSIIFLDSLVGYAVGDGIYKTTDGGINWTFKGGANHLNSISFYNNNFGWTCGRFGQIYRTIDGGNTWSTFYSIKHEKVTDNYLYAIKFVSENEGFAVGEGGTIIRTRNASPTPVELTSFTASISLNKVQLDWQTATELNNLGFEIQRKLENSDWATIGFRTGKGTSTEPTSYFYEDDISEISAIKMLYRLKQIDFDGTVSYSDEVELVTQPFDYALLQNYPNPFNPETIIKYEIPQISNVKIEVFDLLGRVIKVLLDEQKTAGRYEIKFDASSLASGIYYYRIKANDFVQTKKMMLIK